MRAVALVFGLVAAFRAIGRRGWSSRHTGLSHSQPGRGPLLAEDDVDDATRGELAAAWRWLGADDIASGIDGRAAGSDPQIRSARAEHASRRLDTSADVALALHDALVTKETSARVARRVIDVTLRAALEEIAARSAREAAHLTRVLERLLDSHIARRSALLALRLAPPLRRPLPTIAEEGGWERWGIAGRTLEDAARTRALATVERRIGYSDFGFGAPGPSFAASPSASWRRISS